MRRLGLAFFIIPFLVSQAAHARDAQLGKSTVSVSPPAGFCEVDKNNKYDVSWLESVTNLLKSANVYTIAAYPSCREMADARKNGSFIVSKFYVSAPFVAIDKLQPDGVQTTCDELHTRQYSEQDKAEIAKATKEFGNGNTSSDSVALGVLEETKGVVCYVATLQKVKTKTGEVKPILALFAVTSTKNSMIFLYQFTSYTGESSIPTALANLKIIYSDFANTNPK